MKSPKYLTRTPLLLLLLLPLLLSCGGGERVARIGIDDVPESFDITTRDWEEAAESLSESLIGSGLLGCDGRPSRLYMHTPRNNTRLRIDRGQLTSRMRNRLWAAGVAEMEMVRGTSAYAGDPFARQQIGRRQALEDLPSPEETEFSLLTTISEQYQTDGRRSRTVTYIIEMQLTRVEGGASVWEDKHTFSKHQRRPPLIGW